MRDQEHDSAEDNHCERDEVGDTEARGHSFINSQELDPEPQQASCDECRPSTVASDTPRRRHCINAPSDQSESHRLVQLRRMHRHRGWR